MKRFVMLSVAVVSSLLLASDAAAGWGRGGCSGGSCYSGGCSGGSCYSGGYSSGGCSSGGCSTGGYTSSGCSGGVCYTNGAAPAAHASAPAPQYAARPTTQPTRYYFVQNGRTYYYYAYPRAAAPAQVVRQAPAAVVQPSVVTSQPKASAKAISTPVQR